MELSSSVANRLRAAFPSAVAADVDLALGIIEEDRRGPTDHDVGRLVVNGEPLHIPVRIYSPDPEPRSIAGLTAPAQTILHCLFSRHHDGRVREAHLREVISSPCAWVPPYVIQLVGEYVIEIVNVVLENRGYLRQKTYARFVSENPAFMTLTRQRAISYWNCYFKTPGLALHDYAAHSILEVLSPSRAIRGGRVSVGPKAQALIEILERLGSLLRHHDEDELASWIESDRAHLERGNFYGVQHFLSAYGWLSDVTLRTTKGHVLPPIDADRITATVRELFSHAYHLAKGIPRKSLFE